MSKQPSTNVNNPELLIWAAYQLEAFEEWVHQEAIFLKAFELAPLRLSWATRPDIPDKHNCRSIPEDRSTRTLIFL